MPFNKEIKAKPNLSLTFLTAFGVLKLSSARWIGTSSHLRELCLYWMWHQFDSFKILEFIPIHPSGIEYSVVLPKSSYSLNQCWRFLQLDNIHLLHSYYLKYLNYWSNLYWYTPNVSTDLPFGLLQVCYGILSSPYRISNWMLFWATEVDSSNSVNHNRVQALSYSKYSLLF